MAIEKGVVLSAHGLSGSAPCERSQFTTDSSAFSYSALLSVTLVAAHAKAVQTRLRKSSGFAPRLFFVDVPAILEEERHGFQ